MPTSLQRLVSRLLLSRTDTVAVAGAVFVRNSRRNFITQAQEWDYFLGIASVKRQQGTDSGSDLGMSESPPMVCLQLSMECHV